MQGAVTHNCKRGVVLIACGYPTYGNWASQLAASIHFSAPEMPIWILTDGKGNSEISPKFAPHISETIIIPEECYTKEGINNYLKAKTFIYDYSPFEETIFLDADLIWLPYKPITELFEKFKNLDFTMTSRSDAKLDSAHDTLCHWTKGKDILESYPELKGKDKTFYNVSSELIYFKKTDKVKHFFDLVKHFYIEPKVSYRDFGLQVPDELAYTLALLHTDLKPHESPFVPIYWEQYHRKAMKLHEMYNQFYGFSLGGNVQDYLSKDTFDSLAKMYSQRMGLRFHYPARNKRDFVKERINI